MRHASRRTLGALSRLAEMFEVLEEFRRSIVTNATPSRVPMSELVHQLNDLIRLDYDAIEAYEAAIPRIDDVQDRATLTHFCDDHRRHVSELGAAVRELGAAPVSHTDLRHFVRTGRVVVSGVVAGVVGDEAVLRAMYRNETGVEPLYQAVLDRDDLPRGSRAAVERALDDERHHHDWLDRRIGLTPKGEPVLTTFAREL